MQQVVWRCAAIYGHENFDQRRRSRIKGYSILSIPQADRLLFMLPFIRKRVVRLQRSWKCQAWVGRHYFLSQNVAVIPIPHFLRRCSMWNHWLLFPWADYRWFFTSELRKEKNFASSLLIARSGSICGGLLLSQGGLNSLSWRWWACGKNWKPMSPRSFHWKSVDILRHHSGSFAYHRLLRRKSGTALDAITISSAFGLVTIFEMYDILRHEKIQTCLALYSSVLPLHHQYSRRAEVAASLPRTRELFDRVTLGISLSLAYVLPWNRRYRLNFNFRSRCIRYPSSLIPSRKWIYHEPHYVQALHTTGLSLVDICFQ